MGIENHASTQLVEIAAGGYRCLPGIAPYSCGVVSSPGFEIVHVTFQQPSPIREGFERVATFLASAGRPKSALCAISLRSPQPYSFAGFAEFNAEYAAILKSWDLFLGGLNPIARTNVAPAVCPPSEPVLYGFAFTKPEPCANAPTFVVAGAGELPEGVLGRRGIIARGDTSANGIAAKAQFVVDLLENRLHGLGVGWQSASKVNVFTTHTLNSPWPEWIALRVPPLGMHGVRWHFSRPPIEEIEFEMDACGSRTSLWVV